MSNRACVFVDGENFRHSLLKLFPEFDQDDYLPKGEWGKLFNRVVNLRRPDSIRVRTYWYVIDSMDFYPPWFPKPDEQPEELYDLLTKAPGYENRYKDPQGNLNIEEMKSRVSSLDDNRRKFLDRFYAQTTIQDGIQMNHRAIEFRRAGSITNDLYTGQSGTEKAVDVKLATDLIMLRDIYDTAIIVSGDQDFVPAVAVVKDFGKEVVNVAFETQEGKLLPGGARRLNQATDLSLTIKHSELADFLSL